jgi:CubicO group peptidase (beta-lactamase class C family)
MTKWLDAALDYIPRWLEFQMRQSELPGCVAAVAHKGKPVFEEAFGHADATAGTKLTPRHRFRVASHSKSFTAAGIMKLRERGKLHLDAAIGAYVDGLHKRVAGATVAQLLSHSGGIFRDGIDSAHWQERQPFPDAAGLTTALTLPPTLEANTRFKYSNHGFALLGRLIETLTGESYGAWIAREIVEPAGLKETQPDVPLPARVKLARGHSGKWPLGRRILHQSDTPTHAFAAATGFVSTAADLVRFFAQLSPGAKDSVLSVASRREMIRRQWRDPYSSLVRHYGLGIISGDLGGAGAPNWAWFGHSGGFPGFITRTAMVPEHDLTVSVLTNSVDGLAHPWLDGVLNILRCFSVHGAPAKKLAGWQGRWWTNWGAVDLVAAGAKVFVATPAFLNPLMDASELTITGRDKGRIALAGGFASHGEPARLVRDKRGEVTELWLAGGKLLPEAAMVAEMEARYGGHK